MDKATAEWIRQRGRIVAYVVEHPGCTEKMVADALPWIAPELITRCIESNLLRRNGDELVFNGSYY